MQKLNMKAPDSITFEEGGEKYQTNDAIGLTSQSYKSYNVIKQVPELKHMGREI